MKFCAKIPALVIASAVLANCCRVMNVRAGFKKSGLYYFVKRPRKCHSVIYPKTVQDFADIFFKSLDSSRSKSYQFILHLASKIFNVIEFRTVAL